MRAFVADRKTYIAQLEAAAAVAAHVTFGQLLRRRKVLPLYRQHGRPLALGAVRAERALGVVRQDGTGMRYYALRVCPLDH